MHGTPEEETVRRIGYESMDQSRLMEVLDIYFPEQLLTVENTWFNLASSLFSFFSSPVGQNLVSQVKSGYGNHILSLDFQQFQQICHVEEFYKMLEEKPKIALACMSAAVHKVLLSKSENDDLVLGAKVDVRLHNCPKTMIALKNLKAAYIDKLVSVRGTAVKVSTVRPLVVQMFFECCKCRQPISRKFPDGKYSPPSTCNLNGCKSKIFNPLRSTAQTIDFQKIRVQELLKHEDHEEGRVPRTVECELTQDLVDACIPGDVVTVTGIIRGINTYMDIGGGKSKNRNQGFYYLYLEAVSIKNSKSQSTSQDLQDSNPKTRPTELFDLFSFSSKDLEFVAKFKQEHGPDLFRQILQSICPSIYGHELVKAGITLSLFGGVRKHSMDQNKVPVRGDIHVIIVGDPGLGKSQLLQAAAAVSPRGIYVCGNATTKAGLTVAVVKDPMTSDYAFEAGAMVLADSGLCCIDEFDKMSSEHQALLEAMEQQCVSIAKAGLVASLSSRTSVLAAANPAGGHYKMTKPAAEILQKFYLKLRDHNTSADGTPITARQLESLVRLAEARARLDLRVEITDQDATDVVEIMKESLFDKYVDEHGIVDFGRSSGMSQQKEAKRFLNALNKQSELEQKDCFSVSELYSLADRISLKVPDIDALIENLNSVNCLLKKGPKTYQVLSSSYARSQAFKTRG
ncbi:probable DNA helicase MCM8 isoform X2 [Vigna unguiculata]|uniref:probable DNA helicase MCM8 isoform X2 n=1 Tax=Vigna unguiculata TaxID=3917 RepID=UPI0010163C61|nr:probable DNA helicase MCM8 isoform X2 [Vigna unguiculata]